jgi:putative acetyltransferase
MKAALMTGDGTTPSANSAPQMEGLIIRAPEPGDRDGILGVVRDAFSSDQRDASEEVDIVLSTWEIGTAPYHLEFVAVADGAIVGHVLAAPGDLGGRGVVAVAPLAVSPPLQRRGIGRSLMTRLLRGAESADLPLVVLLGLPAYYGQFGFEPSGPLGICYPTVGEDNPHFLVRRFANYDPSYRGDFTYCWETVQG